MRFSATRRLSQVPRAGSVGAAILLIAMLASGVSLAVAQSAGTTQPAASSAPATAPAVTSAPASAPTPASPPAVASAPVSTAPATQPASAPASQPVESLGLEVHTGDVVVFLGDDLTDTPRPTTTNSFPMLVETFLAARYPSLSAHYINVGWSGDTVARALLRLDRDVLSHNPTIIVVCLGLNDPEYLPASDARVAAYRKDLLTLVNRCKQAQARVWLISPPSVDEEKGRKVRIQRAGRPGMTDLQAIGYNATLARYAAAAKDVANETSSGFVDWFGESSAARARGRQADPDFGLTSNGLNPNDRAHAMAAASLLQAWGAKPIEANIELVWATGEVKVSSHLAAARVARAEINAAGERRVVLHELPLPWPMAGGQAGYLGSEWEAARLCQFILRIPDAPERGVTIKLEWAQGPAVQDGTVAPEQLREGFNLAGTEALNASKDLAELFQLIGTKNFYHYGTWRKLALSPPKEAELVEAHRKLIDAWNSYVAGTERIIQNQPKSFDVSLVLSESVPVEQLPTNASPPPVASAAPAQDAGEAATGSAASQPASTSAPATPPSTQPASNPA